MSGASLLTESSPLPVDREPARENRAAELGLEVGRLDPGLERGPKGPTPRTLALAGRERTCAPTSPCPRATLLLGGMTSWRGGVRWSDAGACELEAAWVVTLGGCVAMGVGARSPSLMLTLALAFSLRASLFLARFAARATAFLAFSSRRASCLPTSSFLTAL